MESNLDMVVALVKQHPTGIPLKKLSVFYNQTYHQNLTLSSLGFSSMAELVAFLKDDLVLKGELVIHKSHHRPEQAGNAASTKSREHSKNMEVLGNIVDMVRQNSAGIPLKKLAVTYNQTYRKNLTLSSLGFDSLVCLVESLDSDLVLVGQVVLHKDHCPENQAGAGKSAEGAENNRRNKTVLEKVVAVIKEHPDGIPLKMLAIAYSQKYHQNLASASLGFKTISCLVASLKGDLVVRDEIVFHKDHRCANKPIAEKPGTKDSRPATPQRTESFKSSPPVPLMEFSSSSLPPCQASYPPLISTVPLSSPPVSTPQLAQNQTNQQLYDRIIEVITKFQLVAPSMEQLQTCYIQHFGEKLPLPQYMSMYDCWQVSSQKKMPAQPETTTDPVTVVLETPAAVSTPIKVPQKEQLQKATMPSFLSDSDFPILEAGVSLSKEHKSKLKDAASNVGGAPVFREAYHAQLREIHGANMRAVEAMEEDEEALTGRRRKRAFNSEMVNGLMQDVRREIAAEGQLVTKEMVISRVCQLLQIPSLEAGGIKTWSTTALKDLQYTIREINMFIECTEAATSICTLYELGQSLAGLKDKRHYEELNLGPLCKLELVHRMFKIDSSTKDDDIPQIKTQDILKQLRIFRRQQTKPKVSLPEFMEYLASHYHCDTPYELGIRINSLGLPISTLNKVSRIEHTILEAAREVIQRELEEETREQLRRVKKSVLEPAQGAGSFFSTTRLDLRKKYASMSAAEVVLAVFSNAAGLFSPRMTKIVDNFLLQVSQSPVAGSLFQLAICGGSLAVPPDLVPKDKASKTSQQTKTEDQPTKSLPSEAKLKQYLKDSLSSQNSTVTLAYMASLERKLTNHFHVKDFLSLEHGSFLEFLVKHNQLLQDTLGSAGILCNGTMELGGTGFRPTIQDVFEFINQCGDITSTDPDELSHIESALRSHYRVRDSRDLGYGGLPRLAHLVKRQRTLGGGGLNPVYYESALFAKHCRSRTEGGCEAVGCLGEMSKAQALASLLSCPLLEDLSEWSQWELIFKPLHGSLKEFIERNAANTGLAALEVTPGVLLRITSHTGDKHFSSAAMSLDPVGTAGHLVSMVVTDGITDAPTALLANHMQSSLAATVAREDLSQAEEDMSCYSRVAKFLLACLTRIPTRTCQALLKQVFLEPFSQVLGQAKSKQVLITVAQSDPSHMNCLHRFGILLGITEWVKDYQKKLNPLESQNGFMYTNHLEQVKSNLIDSESSSLSALNASEDEYLEDNTLDTSFGSSQFEKSINQVNGEDGQVKEEEEDGELYELLSLPNGETSDVSSEAEGGQGEAESEIPDTEQNDPAACQSETTVDLQRSIIEDIRKTEFGIGVKLGAEGQKLMQKHQDRLGRSLERLSTELYSKDTHFVLELIQNADDNSYPSETGVTPALAFVVERNCITILNNETGFQERNIRAICDVGRSTKGKHKYGYIGQKGIGFKSVFKVTDCPEIHSNGFHLRFDKTCGPMGYILPHWAEDERPVDAQLKDINQHSWTTKICLPLRSESHQTRNLFHDVHPSLLLFLHRLRSITIYNQSEKRLVTMTRKDLSHGVLEVEHTEGTERWLVVKTTLQPKKIKEDVESTELALAFQLNRGDAEDDIVCRPQKQPVFAYLPLRSFGFRFIIQGDFDIPSSREDVDRDSSWNQWLRSEIPELFLRAMDVFINHPEFRDLKGLCRFLHFIPLPDEVLDFFKPVAGQIIQLLKGKTFLPTLSSEGEVVYKLPSQVAVCQDAVIRNVIGGDELQRHLSLSYLHPSLSNAPPASLLTHLGVRHLRGSDVSTVTTAMAKELMKMGGITSEGGLRQLARLLVCNFRSMEHGYGEADSILQTLRGLPIIPLADSRVVALSEERVFFPMGEKKTKDKKAQSHTGVLSALYKDVNVVHPSLLNCVEPLESQQVRELLKRLGVHELEPQELLEQHIYPSIRSNQWKSKPEAVVVSYLVFIKLHSTSSQEYSDVAVPVLTSRGLLCPANERVHFSVEYGNIDLPERLPGYDWVLLSPCYVETDDDVAGWRELLGRLGVRDGLIIRKEKQTLTAKDLAAGPWSVESKMWPLNPEEGCVIDDYPCEEFHALATVQLQGSILLQQRMALLELLATNWSTGHCYSQYITAQVVDGDGREIRRTKSSFLHDLCSLEWVPGYRVLEGDTQERRYLRPNAVYLSSPEVTSLLGTHVSYVDLSPSEFSRAIGMRHNISVDDLIGYLKKWCVRPDNQEQSRPEDELEGAEFTSTVRHIHEVYNYLSMNCPQSRLKDLFQHTPAVFVVSRYNGDWCSGRFYHLKEVCWSDPTTMFQRYKKLIKGLDISFQEPKVLAPFYKPLKHMNDFFINLLNVEPNPNMNQYVGLLELICSSSPIPTAEVLQDVSVVYARLAQKCKVQVPGDQENNAQPQLDHGYCSTLKGMVSDKKVFPTKDNRWESLARKPMIPDNKELEKIFKDRKEICLLNLPPPEKRAVHSNKTGNYGSRDRPNTVPAFDKDDRSLFLNICGIRQLSRCVKSEPQTESLSACPTVQAMVRSLIPYIQRFLYHHDELHEVFLELVKSNIAEKIKRLCFRQVGKLYIRYQPDIADKEVVEVRHVICLLVDEKELYVQKDHLFSKLDICRELAKLFCTESSHRKELISFLSSLINLLNDSESLKKFLHKEDIKELPSEEEVWEVPKPPEPDITPERVLSRSFSSTPAPEERPRPAQDDGEDTLVCWPPRAPLHNTGASSTAHKDSGVVEAVMKKWPPPPGPNDREPERDVSHRGSGQIPSSNRCNANEPPSSSRLAEQPGPPRVHPEQPNDAAVNSSSTPSPPEPRRQSDATEQVRAKDRGESLAAPEPPSAQPSETAGDQPAPNSLVVPDAVVLSGTFQGTSAAADTPRPLNLDFPQLSSQTTLEDMELTCQRPTTVVLSDDAMELTAIGVWGEQLVNSFLCQWRDGEEGGRPTHILWCNQSGESGQPYDFKLTFGPAGGPQEVVYVEVKSTVKKERSFIHLSANELDFALKERERYHIYRVYSAGDSQHVRLCRIQNLAQHLHTKDLALYLFV